MMIRLNRVRLLGAAALVAGLAVAPAGTAAEPEGAGPGRNAQRTDQTLAQAGKSAQQGQHGSQTGQSAATQGQAAGQGQQGQQSQRAQQSATTQGQQGQRSHQGATAVNQAEQGGLGAYQNQQGQRAQQSATAQGAQGQRSGQSGSAQGTTAAAREVPARNYTGMNARFVTPLENRCVYTASVRGVVAPAKTWDRSDMQRNLHPELKIEAELACPNQPTVATMSSYAPTGPITRSELETELERRATLNARDNGGRCAYAPDFIMTDNFFASRGITYMCSLNWPVANGNDQ